MNSLLAQSVRAGLVALMSFSMPAFAGLLVDADPDWKEGAAEMPAAPQDAGLRSFDIGSTSPNAFFVDEQSVSVGEDGVVRYTLVVRTPGGAENVTSKVSAAPPASVGSMPAGARTEPGCR